MARPAVAASAPPLGRIDTMAGGLGSGAPNNVGQAPAGIAVADGKVVVTDPSLDVIRTFSLNGLATAGDEVVLAGTGVTGYTGDGAPATTAKVSLAPLPGTAGPAPGVVIDAAGDTYFADTYNHVVRKIDPSGVVSTVAGTGVEGNTGDNGPATQARLTSPSGLALDSSGSLYISDAGANVIRKLIAPFGLIATVPTPTGATALKDPTGIAVDSSGNLYIADTGNCAIRKVAGSTTSVVAGVLGTCNYASGVPTSAHLRNPAGLAVDTAGNVFIADQGNCIVRELVVASSALNIVAGKTPTGSNGSTTYCTDTTDSGGATSIGINPAGVALTPDGLFVADQANGRVRAVSGTSMSTLAGRTPVGWSGDSAAATAAELNQPTGVAAGPDGSLYVADGPANVVRSISPAGVITTVAGTGTPGYSADGTLATAASLSNPTGVAVDATGNVFVVDNVNCVIREVGAADGKIKTVAGMANQCGSTMDFGGSAVAAKLADPYALAISPVNGLLYMSDSGGDRIRAIDVANNTITTVAGTNSDGVTVLPDPLILNEPRGLAFDKDGNLFIADADNNRVRRLTGAGALTTVAGAAGSSGSSGDGGPAASARLSAPYGVAVDSAGDLLISDRFNQTVREIDTAGTIRLVAGKNQLAGFAGDGGAPTAALLNVPLGLATASDNSVYVADSFNARVRVLTAATVPGPPTSVAATPGPASATVTWSAPTSDGGSAITGYTVTSDPDAHTASVGGSVHTATVSGLSPDKAYTFTVKATNGVGMGVASDASNAVVPQAAPVTTTTTTTAAGPAKQTSTGSSPATPGPAGGYWLVASDGGIFNFGSAPFYGSTGAITLNKPIVAAAATPTGKGYWLVASDGGIFNFGDAAFYGSTGALKLNKPIVAATATPTGKGYWLVASDGGIFNFGDAAFYGSTGALTLNKPIVAVAATPTGKGYWLVASDGGIFNFGDAAFYGSTGALKLNRPIVAAAVTLTGKGYWLTASDGGIFNFGDAAFYGSTGAITLNKPIVAMASSPTGAGYWLVATDGGIFNFGDAAFSGSAGSVALNKPIVAVAR